MGNLSFTAAKPSSLFHRIVGSVTAIALIGLVLMFSALLLIVIITIGIMAWGCLWWKTRGLRKQLREHQPGEGVIGCEEIRGEVIEGEVIHVADTSHRVGR